MSINKRMDKEDVVYIHTHTHIYIVEYYSVIKRNKIVPFVETWMGPETVTHNEVSQKEKKNVVC